MIALVSILALVVYLVGAALLGRRLRRARKQQTRPVLHVLYDSRLDIRPAQRKP